MLVQRGHTYVAAASIPSWVPLSAVRRELVAAGFDDVSVRSADGRNYNVVGEGTWTRADQSVDLPDEIVWVHDVTPAEAPAPEDAGAPEVPEPLVVAPTSPSPIAPPAPAPYRPRRRPARPPDHSVQIVAVAVAAIGAGVLWKLKKSGFWERRAWR